MSTATGTGLAPDEKWKELEAIIKARRRFLHDLELAKREIAKADVEFAALHNSVKLRDEHKPAADRLFESLKGFAALEFVGQARALRLQLGRFFASGRISKMALKKERGCPGDFETMELVCQSRIPKDQYWLQYCADEYLHKQPAAEAVRARVRRVREEVNQLTEGALQGRLKILSVGCGPAVELRMLADNAYDKLEVHLIDLDQDALDNAAEGISAASRRKCVAKTYAIDVFQLMRPTIARAMTVRDFDLVYCMGLLDYMDDRQYERLAEHMLEIARPDGGIVLLGNFLPTNPSKAYMEWALDWHLNHRARELQEVLVERAISGLVSGGVSVSYEVAGDVNGIVRCVRNPKEVTT